MNPICVEDGIDSSKEAGKLLISIIAAVAEMERENIRVQTMAGREQKAREGKWNGGFVPYGYKLKNGELVIAEDEVEIIQMIFDRYIHTGMSFIRIFSNNLHILKFCIFSQLVLLCIKTIAVNLNSRRYTSIYVTSCFFHLYPPNLS